jgi:hypothetical protein
MNIPPLSPALDAGNIAGMIDLILLIAAGFTIGAALLGLFALYNALGMAALWIAVGLLYVLYFALERRGAAYFNPGGAFGGPALPAPSTQRLPAPGPRQIGQSRRSALTGPKK